MPDERGRDIGVAERVGGRPDLASLGEIRLEVLHRKGVSCCGDTVAVCSLKFLVYLAVLDPVYETERNPILLVKEKGVFLELAGSAVEDDVQLPGVHGGVPDAAEIPQTAVLRPADAVVKVSGVGHVTAAKIIGRHLGVLVGRSLVVEYASASETVIREGEVELGGDVLGGKKVEVVGLPFSPGH